MTTPADELRALADILTNRSWSRAVELAAANRSPLRATTGGGGSIGDHSDPTAAAALTPHHGNIPTASALRAALRVVATHLDIDPRHPHLEATVAGRLRHAADTPPIARPLLAAVQIALTLYGRTITPQAAADWILGQEAPRDAVGPDSCEACDTPRPHCGALRDGWCNPCRMLFQRRQQRDGRLLAPDGRQVFAGQVARDIAAGLVRRPWSPHRPGATVDTGMCHVERCETSS